MRYWAAICTFRYDLGKEEYQSEFFNLNAPSEGMIFISVNPNIFNQRIKYAVGKQNVEKLKEEHEQFLLRNKTTENEEVNSKLVNS